MEEIYISMKTGTLYKCTKQIPGIVNVQDVVKINCINQEDQTILIQTGLPSEDGNYLQVITFAELNNNFQIYAIPSNGRKLRPDLRGCIWPGEPGSLSTPGTIKRVWNDPRDSKQSFVVLELDNKNSRQTYHPSQIYLLSYQALDVIFSELVVGDVIISKKDGKDYEIIGFYTVDDKKIETPKNAYGVILEGNRQVCKSIVESEYLI